MAVSILLDRDPFVICLPVGQRFSAGVLSVVASSVSGMDMDRFPSVTAVRVCPPGELAVWLSTMSADAVRGLPADAAEAVVVATQRVSSWMFGLQSVAVDRFAEHVMDAQEAHAADLMAARDALREQAESSGGVWRGDRGAVSLPEPEQIAASMLAPELRISPRTMRARLNRARSLMELPTTLGLALSGDLEPWRVDAVVAAAADVGVERLVEFESRLYAGDVSGLPKPRLAERARGAAAKADPESVARGEARAPRRRCLRVGASQVAGVMRWTADIPDELSRRMFAAIDELAQQYLAADREIAASRPGDGVRERRTVEQARLDALGDLVMGNARVETVVDLLVPVATGTRAAASAAASAAEPSAGHVPATFVDRRDARTAAEAAFGGTGHSSTGGGDAVVVELVLGQVTRDTLAAGRLERTHGLTLGAWLETDANPFLSHRPPRGCAPSSPLDGASPGSTPSRAAPPTPLPRVTDLTGASVWFIPGLVQTPGATALLPSQITALLADPDTRIRVTDTTPGVADGTRQQRRTYRPHAALAAKVRARDRHCRFPGCSVPANRCHLDHVTPHPVGETIEANLQTLCPAHHGFKHHAGWTVTMTADGTCTWITPAGRNHTTTPPNAQDTAA